MKRLLFLLLTLVGLVVPCLAQFKSPVTFRVVDEKTPDGKLLVRFVGQVDAGWHVYSTDIPEGGPTAASITIEKMQGLQSEGKLRSVGKVHRAQDPMFGMEVSYMEGVATFEQTFTITAEEYSVEGYMTYGACNDENCLPPTAVEFSFRGKADVTSEPQTVPSPQEMADTVAQDTLPQSEPTAFQADADLWAPVIEELHQTDSAGPLGDKSLITIFLLGLLGGLVALLTPCVWPIIPMTVSFFLKRSKDNRRQGIRDAMTYGVSIVVIYVLLGLLVTIFFGASKLNELSTNAVFNIFFFLLLLLI